ncbi:Hypothetical predicted protein [Mytilus galloprovincialis]|uniref:Uncharacterized protein n=1 Tax=Mytilus galloprovincialis TaxID=29158 RepID=A0A8B6FH31_MYTGA|nr:Hypothetical predicted protein [Mytilus galloprovincialis]
MMHNEKYVLLFVVLLLILPSGVRGGPICYVSCLASVGATALFGTAAILPAIGFTSSGITAGSWAATWMASFAGAVPAGSLFATFQSAGMTGATAKLATGATGSAAAICAAICAPLP